MPGCAADQAGAPRLQIRLAGSGNGRPRLRYSGQLRRRDGNFVAASLEISFGKNRQLRARSRAARLGQQNLRTAPQRTTKVVRTRRRSQRYGAEDRKKNLQLETEGERLQQEFFGRRIWSGRRESNPHL